VWSINNGSNLNIPEHITKNQPEIIKHAINTFPDGVHEKYKNIIMEFETEDVFSVNNPVKFKIQADVKNPDLVKSVYLIRIQNIGENPDPLYLLDISNKFGNSWELVKQETDMFFVDGKFTPSIEKTESFFIVYFEFDGYYNISDVITLDIHSSATKIQSETNRALTMFAEQTEINNIEQKRTNLIIEGLSWIIVAWIPFGVAFEIVMIYFIRHK